MYDSRTFEFESFLDVAQNAFAESNYAYAEECFNAALKGAELAHGKSSPAVGIIALNFADFLTQQGRFDEARPLIRRACMSLYSVQMQRA